MQRFLDRLNPQQREAALCIKGPLIIFAGAGTGKTRVITYRIAHLLNQGVSPLNILAVTFTNKAAGEMRRRVDELAPGRGRSVWISTFHSFCANFLRIEAKRIGLEPNFLIYDESDQKSVLKGCIKELNLDEKKFKPGRILEIISRAKDDLLDADSYSIHALTSGDHFRQMVAAIYGLYQKKLKQTGALDFGDLLLTTVVAMRNNEVIRDKYQKRFKYVMVDEYQDTNHAQYLLTKYIVSQHKNICVVGDDDQSIYSWRGADVRNILEFERDYSNCRVIKLEQNYRSTSNILSSAWFVIKNNEKRIDKKLWTDKPEGKPIKLLELENGIEEAQYIARQIACIREKDSKCHFWNFAVFYRTNAQSRVLEDAFRREGIPYTIVGTVRFYERAEVKDILAYLRLIHNPRDNVSFKRVINVPRRGIGKATVNTLEKFALTKSISLWDTLNRINILDISSQGRKGLIKFRELMEELRFYRDTHTVKEIAIKVLEKTAYIEDLESEDTLEAKNRIDNLSELISAIDEFESRSPDKSLTGYLTQVALITDLDEWNDTNDRVTLMTLHLAKGLEFDTVFISGLEEGLFPIGDSGFDEDELEEERRLMYVGMTRAKENLYLSWAQERMVFGRTHWNMPSRFLSEAKAFDLAQKEKAGGEPRPCAQGLDEEIYIEYEPEEAALSSQKDADSYQGRGRPEASSFKLGARVRHEQFGEGKVIDRSGSGDNLKVVVLFNSGKWKKLIVKYANLKKI